MLDSEFLIKLNEIRESIYQGEVSEGANALSKLLMTCTAPDQRGEVLLELALLSIVSGDIDEGRVYWKDAREVLSSSMTTRCRVFTTFFQITGQFVKKSMMARFEPYILESPDTYEYYLIRGMCYLEQQQFEHAQADLERANTLCPNNVLVLSTLAESEMDIGDTDRAIQLNETVLEACPSFRRSLINLGILYFDAGRYEDSYRLFRCLVAYEPMNWFAWTCLGDVRMEMPGKTFQSLPAYAAAIISGTTVSQTYINLAKGLMMLGRYHRAINVLDKFESMHGRWTSEDIVPVRYFRLMTEVIDNPGLVRSKTEFMQRFRHIRPRADDATILLFHMLASSVSFSYNDDIMTIFRCHMSAFIHLAGYMQQCENRVIHVEEAILLGMLARMFIWNGFLFEARAIITLLLHAEDPHISDMCDILWSELYRYCEMSKHAGVDVPNYHEMLFRMPNAEKIYSMLLEGRVDDVPYDTSWRQLLVKHLYSVEAADIGGMMFGVPLNDIMQKVIMLDDMSHDYGESLLKFWALCESYALDRVFNAGSMPEKITDTFKSGLSKEWLAQYEAFCRTFEQSDCEENAVSEEKESDYFCRMLVSIRENRPDAADMLEKLALNSNGVQECAASLDEALSGYEPLPFTVDGTAYKRMMKMPEIETIDEESATDLFRELCLRYSMVVHRGMTNEALNVHDPENMAQYNYEVDRTVNIWKMLHGREKVSPQALQLTKNTKKSQAAAGVLFGMSGFSPAALELLIASELNMIGLGGWYFPKSPLASIPMIYRHQHAPKQPLSASMLNQVVSDGMLTRVDIVEQFYNRAVTAIQEWMNRHSPESLSIFFTDDLYTFRTHLSFEDPALKQKASSGSCYFDSAKTMNRHFNGPDAHCTEGGEPAGRQAKRRRGPGMDNFNINDDIEEDIGGCHRSLSGDSGAREPFYDENVIHNVQEMSDQLSILMRNCLKGGMPPMYHDYERFNKGGINHPFAIQFMAWAERHAEALYLDIARLESMARNLKVSEQYLLIWRIKDLLARYPFLSRLYVVLAGVYAKIGDADKAMQAIRTGVKWEDRLYSSIGWKPILSKTSAMDLPLEPVEASTEFEDTQPLLWQERFVFLNNDETMYHYGPYKGGVPMRCRKLPSESMLFKPVMYSDKGGAYEFYRLFKKFIVRVEDLREAWLSGLSTPGVYSLCDYFKHVLIHMVNPATFPLRRQIAELMYQLYPTENPCAHARFYCDNLQPTNALPYAAYAYFLGNEDDAVDPSSQSALTIGCLLYDMGYMELSVEYLEEAVSVKNPPPMAYLTLGCACVELRRFDEAIDYLKAGLVLDPSSDRFYYNMSLAYFEIEEYEEAEKAVKMGISLSKYPVDLNMQLMRINVFNGKFMDALPLASYVAAEDPEMFLSAIVLDEFREFRKLEAVRSLLLECGFDLSELPENNTGTDSGGDSSTVVSDDDESPEKD